MPTGESAGAIYVTIDADGSPLLAKYAQAEAQSRAAGTRIAAGLGQGLQAASGIVDQFGRAVSSGISAPMEAAAPAVEKTAVAIRTVGAAAESSVPQISAMSGAIRVLSGEQSIRAIERFGVSVLGLGTAAQAVFPIIGAIAVGELLDRVYNKFSNIKNNEDQAASAAGNFSDEIQSADDRVKTLDADIVRLKDGAIAGFGASLQNAQDKVAEKVNALRAAQEKLNTQPVSGGVGTSGVAALTHGASSSTATPQAQAVQKAAVDELEALREVDIAVENLRHAREDAANEAAKEEARAAKESAEEQKRAAADVAREAKRQQDVIYQLSKQGYRLQTEASKKASEDISRDLMRGLEESSRELEQSGEEDIRIIQRTVQEANRLNEEKIKAGGDRAQSSDEASKLLTEQQYALQIVHTRQQELQYAKDIAAADEKQLSDRIANLEALKEFQQVNALYDEANRTDLEIEKAKAALLKQQIEDATKLQGIRNKQDLGLQLNAELKQVAPALSGALAKGIMDGGKGIGKDITSALKGIGQKMLDDIFTRLIEQLGVNAAIDAITNTLGATHITAQAANTAALVANTAAVTASAGVGAAGGAAAGIGGAAGSAASGAVSSIIGPVIGGIVSGVISAAATFIGDAAIVKAINQTTQAVLSLRVTGVGQVQSGTPTGNQQTQIQTPNTGFLTNIGASLFQAITGSGGLPVKIVAISPLAPLAGIFSLFGFAKGGRPAPGVPYIVGENGPELRIDDGPGVVIPGVPSMSQLNGLQNSSSFSSSSHSQALSIGSLHVHGMQSAEQFARALPRVLKTRAPSFSPATR